MGAVLGVVVCAAVITASVEAQQPKKGAVPDTIYVDAARGKDSNKGKSARRPLKSLSAAISILPDVVTKPVTIEVRGEHASTGGQGYSRDGQLVLMRRTTPGAFVRILGMRDEGRQPVFGWSGDRSLVEVTEGSWRIENVQVGSFETSQRRGVLVVGPGHAELKDVTFRTRSLSGAGIRVERGGRVWLRGAIRLNEHLHDEAPGESFCGIVAADHGVVKFVEKEGASLSIGNGSLSAMYYGCIRLGCATARVTSWGRQSNCIAVNNSGRVDLHGTTTTLCAKKPENTPIGPEHDGHILGEGAHVKIVGENRVAIALQKASTFTCNDIELAGEFRLSLWVMSGSTFVGRFLTDVGKIEAHTGGSVHLEACKGEIHGPVVATSGAVISLPGNRVVRGDGD